ncbi:FG-GAP-like repeat-containing protein, partial [bacterium]|nr:FG-GAP-like repeat-containing protein [bacterium]
DFFLAEMLSPDYGRRKTQEGPTSPVEAQIGQIDNRPQYMRNSLFLNRGDHTYAEVTSFGGVEASEWSWTPIFLDVDLDGFEDLIISTGHYYDAMDMDTQTKLKTMSVATYNQLGSEIFAYPQLKTPNFIFRNSGALTFTDKSREWGFETTDISHGMAVGDLDNDGDLDVVMNRLFEAPLLYRNDSGAPRISVRLNGMKPNTQAVGAKIRLFGGPVIQSHEVIAGGNYLSHSDQLASFAAPDPHGEFTLEVVWPSGRKSVLNTVAANRIYEFDETHAEESHGRSSNGVREPKYFEDVSHLINHQHHEDPFNDFERQPLLPKRLSQLGPGVAWHDYDQDGDDDLFVTSGRGGQMSILVNEGGAKFTRLTSQPFPTTVAMDQAAVIGWTEKEDKSNVLIAFSNFEASDHAASYLTQLSFNNGEFLSEQQIPINRSSPGPTAMADYDGDGDVDLFVGGRSIPGRYPVPATSVVYQKQNVSFLVDEENSKVLQNIGLVSGAVFSDFDNDSDPDLLLAVEWGPITVLRNEHGRFIDATSELGLAESIGWWNGITTGDLNGDGRLDIIATNWGLNTPYRVESGEPVRLFYSDFDNNGTLDILESYFDVSCNAIVAHRGLAAIRAAIPFIGYNTPTHQAFSKANLEEVIGARLRQAGQLHANTLKNTVFLNLENTFEAVPMPTEAQFSPAFHAGVSDFDGDGHEDVFISQNFFAYPSETHRSDAGRGIWLKGDGTGDLTAVAGQKSGIQVYGEQRGAALGDFDQDGRVDVAISQNGATTKLYRNAGAKPGLRVRLVGPPENRTAIGATIRLIYENRYGPSREVHSGSGYWSQDSAVQVMGATERPTGVWVRWPDGSMDKYAIEEPAGEVTIRYAVAASGNREDSME